MITRLGLGRVKAEAIGDKTERSDWQVVGRAQSPAGTSPQMSSYYVF